MQWSNAYVGLESESPFNIGDDTPHLLNIFT